MTDRLDDQFKKAKASREKKYDVMRAGFKKGFGKLGPKRKKK